MKDLILVGKQGAGKGTMGEFLIKDYGFRLFETGGELRKIAQQETELGRKVKDITTRGDLVPNEVVMEIVRDFLQGLEGDTPVLFDGIPRSQVQQQSLEVELEKAGRDFQVLELQLDNEVAVKRLIIRGQCKACGKNFGGDVCPLCGSTEIARRADDNETAIRRRLANFDKHTAPLLEEWKAAGKLISVDGRGGIEEVWGLVKAAMGTRAENNEQ